MQNQEIVCDGCCRAILLTPEELSALIEAFMQGDRERLRCPHCGASLGRPIQQATGVKASKSPADKTLTSRRRHTRLPLDRQVLYYVLAPSPAPPRLGRIKDLSDGGLRLVTTEALLPSTQVALQLQTGTGGRLLIGTVVWKDASCAESQGMVEHGVQFTEEIPGAATTLFFQEFLRGGSAPEHTKK